LILTRKSKIKRDWFGIV